jgi:hypothetical protein
MSTGGSVGRRLGRRKGGVVVAAPKREALRSAWPAEAP